MKQLRLSGHSCDKAACPMQYYLYRVQGRSLAGVSPALCQGIAGHGAIARWRRGQSQADQDAYVDAVFAAHPQPEDDFRTPYYLREALAQYKVEHAELVTWDFEEVETAFELPLGVVEVAGERVEVLWTGRRDAVGRFKVDGRRYVLDNKFSSRDQTADVVAYQNQGAFKGYCWSCRESGKPVVGVIVRRMIIRAPTKPKPFNFSLPLDPPIYFSDEILDEWKNHTLLRAAELLARDPEQMEAWPMVSALCRGPFGCCDYLPVCLMPPRDRLVKLMSDAYRDSGDREAYDAKEEA